MAKKSTPIRIVADANFLVKFLDRKANQDDLDRINHLLDQIKKNAGSALILPMPCVAEYLVYADEAGLKMLDILESSPYVVVAPFDRKSAFECALIELAGLNSGDKRHGVTADEAPYQKIKVDRQVVAIAKANAADQVISEDVGVSKICNRVGLKCIKISDLTFPDKKRQKSLEV